MGARVGQPGQQHGDVRGLVRMQETAREQPGVTGRCQPCYSPQTRSRRSHRRPQASGSQERSGGVVLSAPNQRRESAPTTATHKAGQPGCSPAFLAVFRVDTGRQLPRPAARVAVAILKKRRGRLASKMRQQPEMPVWRGQFRWAGEAAIPAAISINYQKP
jgi:hypothetical protein